MKHAGYLEKVTIDPEDDEVLKAVQKCTTSFAAYFPERKRSFHDVEDALVQFSFKLVTESGVLRFVPGSCPGGVFIESFIEDGAVRHYFQPRRSLISS